MIASAQNVLVKHLVKLRENKHYREKCGSILVSGIKLIREIAVQTPPNKLFVLDPLDSFLDVPTYQISPAVLKKITGLPSPEPIAAEFPLPPQSSMEKRAPILVLDAIRDPGNLGTLLRTSLAFGWGGVFFLPTCVDPFNEKVIRSSRGALFRLPWKIGTWEDLSKLKETEKLTAYIADIEGEALTSIQKEKNLLLILSNEAHGVCQQGEAFGKKITIPMEEKMESLNVSVAGAILMYFLKVGL